MHTMMVRGEAYIITPKMTQKIPTKFDLAPWVWNNSKVMIATMPTITASMQSPPIILSWKEKTH